MAVAHEKFSVAVWIDRLVVIVAVLTTAACLGFLSDAGRYYALPLWERPDFPLHRALRPSGAVGHVLGIVGASMVVVGVLMYSGRKRLWFLQGRGPMRTWLNVHIYLCLTGPVLVTFHTALKFRGLGVYSFWSMWIVAGSGIIGRWIYQQFPRTIKGTEMSLEEIRAEQDGIHARLATEFNLPAAALQQVDAFAETSVTRLRRHATLLTLPLLFADDLLLPWRVAGLRRRLHLELPHTEVRTVLALLRRQVVVQRRIAFLGMFRRLFLYWHVAHLIFFFAMFILLVLHVGAAVYFGATMAGG